MFRKWTRRLIRNLLLRTGASHLLFSKKKGLYIKKIQIKSDNMYYRFFNAMIYLMLIIEIYIYTQVPKPINPAEFYKGYSIDGEMGAVLYEEYRENSMAMLKEIKLRTHLVRRLMMPVLCGFLVTMYAICTKPTRQVQDTEDLKQVDEPHENQKKILNQEIIPNEERTGEELHEKC